MSDTTFSIDPELEARLVELGDRLEVPLADTLTATVLERVRTLPDDPVTVEPTRSVWRQRLLVAAVVLLVVGVGLFAYTPTRVAIADWLGIGAVRITPVEQLPPVPAPSSSVPTTTVPSGNAAVAPAQPQVSFPIALPDPARSGPVVSVDVDRTVPGGLVSIAFDSFVLTEVAAEPGQRPVMTKFVGPGTNVEYVTVNGHDAAWISGAPHEWAYLDPQGNLRTQTVRRSGDALVWETGGVTYRIEGPASKDEALAIAAGVR